MAPHVPTYSSGSTGIFCLVFCFRIVITFHVFSAFSFDTFCMFSCLGLEIDG